MTMLTRFIPLLLLVLAALPTPARAAPSDVCAPTQEISPTRMLRQASLDLRGTLPAYEEYQGVLDAEDPAAEVDARIDDYLLSEAYFEQVRQYHTALVWGTLSPAILDNPYAGRARISEIGAISTWRVGNLRGRYRGRGDVECLDQPQTSFDGQGRPIPISTFADAACTDGVCQQEGWVMVAPYWAPETAIKVCAYDAQAMATGTDGAPCDSYGGADALCGCGPSLRWCGPSSNADPANIALRASLAEEPARIFEAVVRSGASYLEAFTTSTTYMNGPMAHFYAYNSGSASMTTPGAVSYDPGIPAIPALPFTSQDTWVAVERQGVHAGAFTTLSYLVRFSSNRSRANRFFTAFYCDPFVPSENGLLPEEVNPNPNLRERAVCSDCHQTLEPAAAHWGRWRNNGTYGHLAAADYDFETPLDTCICGAGTDRPTCSSFCSQYFVTADNVSDEAFNLYAGLPQAAAWLDDTDLAHVDAGPAALLETPDQVRQIAACTVRNLSEHLLGRTMAPEDLAWLETHTDAFEGSDYDFNALMSALVHDDRYRSIR